MVESGLVGLQSAGILGGAGSPFVCVCAFVVLAFCVFAVEKKI